MNKFSFVGDKLIGRNPDLYIVYANNLRKTKNESKNSMKQKIVHTFFNWWSKPCFPNDITYKDYKESGERTTSDEILCNKAFILTTFKNDDIQIGLATMVCKFMTKIFNERVIKSHVATNKKLHNEFHISAISKVLAKMWQPTTIFTFANSFLGQVKV